MFVKLSVIIRSSTSSTRSSPFIAFSKFLIGAHGVQRLSSSLGTNVKSSGEKCEDSISISWYKFRTQLYLK